MNEQDDFARRIVSMLDDSAANIEPKQRERLSAAREAALAKYRPAPVTAPVPAWAGGLSRFTEHRLFGVRYLIPIAALVIGLAGVLYMNTSGGTPDIADIDAGLLTDELPINAYLDKGFDSWLKRSSR